MKFGELVKGQLSMTKYEAKFAELSQYPLHVTSTDREKTRKFRKGLAMNIQNRIVPLILPTTWELLKECL